MTKEQLHEFILRCCESASGFCMDNPRERDALTDIITSALWDGESFITGDVLPGGGLKIWAKGNLKDGT